MKSGEVMYGYRLGQCPPNDDGVERVLVILLATGRESYWNGIPREYTKPVWMPPALAQEALRFDPSRTVLIQPGSEHLVTFSFRHGRDGGLHPWHAYIEGRPLSQR